jgi:hypothetical protein
VFDFVIQEYLADPTIHFVHPITKKIMDEMLVQKESEGWPGSAYFINHADSEVAAFTAAIFSQEYQLSPAFLDNLIYVKTESDNFRSALIDIFLSLRRTKIEELIIAELEKLKIPDQDHEETMEYLNSDVSKLKEIVQLLHSELKLMQTEIIDLKKQLSQHIDEVYIEIDTLAEKLTTDIQTVQTTIDGKLEYVCGLIDESNDR